MNYRDHDSHLLTAHCEECGRQICACLSVCESCHDRLELEAEEEGQRWADSREYPADGGKYF